MGRLFTNWRSWKHASRPGLCRKYPPSAWQSVQPTATLHSGCADWRLPSAQRRILLWSPGLWPPSTGALPSRGEAQAHRNAATTPDDRAVAALAALSWTMWLRVGEAASFRYCDLDRMEGLWFYSTKVGGPGCVCRPAAAYARSWMKFLWVYCQAKGKRPDKPFLQGGGGGFLEDAISSLLRDTKLADARLHALRRGGSAACWVRKPAAKYLLFSGRWAGLRTAMGYALGFRDPRLWANWCYRMLARLSAWAYAALFYLRLCGVWLCMTSRGLRSIRWNRRTRALRLLLGMLAVVWWRKFRKSRASLPLPLTAPSRAHPRPSRDHHRSHDHLALPRPSSSPLLLGYPLKSSSCPILTWMRMLGMGREFIGLRTVCQIWGASPLWQMPSGLARPALGGWSPVSDPGNRGHGGSSTRPPLPVLQYCVASPSRVGGPDAFVRQLGSSALCQRGRFPKLRSVRPVSDPQLVRVLPPVVGFPSPQVGVGGGGGLAPGLRDVPRPPTGSAEGGGSSAHERLGAVAVGCEASNAAPSAPPLGLGWWQG